MEITLKNNKQEKEVVVVFVGIRLGPVGGVCSVEVFLTEPSIFMRVSEKSTENSERLGRQARPGFGPGTSRLPVLTLAVKFSKLVFIVITSHNIGKCFLSHASIIFLFSCCYFKRKNVTMLFLCKRFLFFYITVFLKLRKEKKNQPVPVFSDHILF